VGVGVGGVGVWGYQVLGLVWGCLITFCGGIRGSGQWTMLCRGEVMLCLFGEGEGLQGALRERLLA